MRNTFLITLALLLVIPAAIALDLPPGVIKLAEYQQQLAASITFLVALIAGILTFTSPCGFVVLPMFFTYLFKERKRAVLMTGAFALGMSIAFVALGVLAGSAGTFINQFKMPFAFASGFALVFFGILLFLNLGFSIFYFKLDHKKAASAWSTGLMGFFFALGWTPCLGPILTGIMILAANTGTAFRGALMLGTYAVGVSVPLLIISALADRWDLANKPWIRGKHIQFDLFGHRVHTHTYNIIGGIILISVGALMIVQSGTFFFMEQLPRYLPWTMTFFVNTNQDLASSPFLTSQWGNALGIFLIALIIWAVYRAARHKEEPLREV
jgi:cytochrome c biogenesis protein CcdA